MKRGDKVKNLFYLIWFAMTEEERETALKMCNVNKNDVEEFLRTGQAEINAIDDFMEAGCDAYE